MAMHAEIHEAFGESGMNADVFAEKGAACDLKKKLVGFFSLLGSGLVAAVCFMLIASQRWPHFDPRVASFIILFVQWQTLGITISKAGIENLVFAVITADGSKTFAAGNFITTTVIPICALFSVVVGAVFSVWSGVVAFASIIVDVYSIIIMAEFNARGQYLTAAAANFINYPLFFAILFYLKHSGWLTTEAALAAFLASSLLRFLWLTSKRLIPAGHREFRSEVTLKMGIQQVFNFLLYRVDQLLLALYGLKAPIDDHLGLYVYMAKFPEIWAGVMVILGTLLFPTVHVRYPFTFQSLLGQLRPYRWHLPACVLLPVLFTFGYVAFWNGGESPYYLVLPFSINALLILFANNITYSMLRQGYLRGLVANMTFAVAVGCLLSLGFLHDFDFFTLAWIVPFQLTTFLVVSLRGKWGERIAYA